MTRGKRIATIFAGYRELNITEDERAEFQKKWGSKHSLKAMSDDQLEAVIDGLRSEGFRPGKGQHKPAARPDIRFIHVLWGKLKAANRLKNPTRKGLNAFIRKKCQDEGFAIPLDVDKMTDGALIHSVTTALKAWCKREGIEL